MTTGALLCHKCPESQYLGAAEIFCLLRKQSYHLHKVFIPICSLKLNSLILLCRIQSLPLLHIKKCVYILGQQRVTFCPLESHCSQVEKILLAFPHKFFSLPQLSTLYLPGLGRGYLAKGKATEVFFVGKQSSLTKMYIPNRTERNRDLRPRDTHGRHALQ